MRLRNVFILLAAATSAACGVQDEVAGPQPAAKDAGTTTSRPPVNSVYLIEVTDEPSRISPDTAEHLFRVKLTQGPPLKHSELRVTATARLKFVFTNLDFYDPNANGMLERDESLVAIEDDKNNVTDVTYAEGALVVLSRFGPGDSFEGTPLASATWEPK